MRKLKKFITLLLAAVIMLTFAACSAKSAFEFDKDAAVKRAKEVIDVVNTKDYEAIFNAFSGEAKKLTTVDGIKAAFQPFLDPTGAFVEYKSAEAISSIAKDGKKHINVYVKTTYDNVSHVYNVAFDADLKLEGFFTMS